MFKLRPIMPGCPACPKTNLELKTITFDFTPKVKNDTRVTTIYYKKKVNKNSLF